MKRLKSRLYFTFIFIISFILIIFIDGYFSERVDVYIKMKASLYSSSIIEKAINEEVVPHLDSEKLLKIIYNGEKVESVYINTNQVNELLALVNASLQKTITAFPEDDLALPMGLILSDTLFSDFGPNLYVDIYPVGTIATDIVSTTEEYGINSSILKVSIKTTVKFMAMVPLNKEEITVVNNIPLVIQVINGEVPRYYSNSNDKILPIIDNE